MKTQNINDNQKASPGDASKEWHPNAPMNPNNQNAQPQPTSTPDPSSARQTPPVTESDDAVEHKWRADDSLPSADDGA